MRTLIATLAIILAACSGGDGYDSIEDVITAEQCTVDTRYGDTKMFAEAEVHCADGTIISWHANERDRNAYADVIESMWSVDPDEQGTNYNVYR